MLMSSEQESDFIDEIKRQKKSIRKGNFNPSREEISKATEEYIKSGRVIKKVVPDWEKSMEDFVNMSIDTFCNADEFLFGAIDYEMQS